MPYSRLGRFRCRNWPSVSQCLDGASRAKPDSRGRKDLAIIVTLHLLILKTDAQSDQLCCLQLPIPVSSVDKDLTSQCGRCRLTFRTSEICSRAFLMATVSLVSTMCAEYLVQSRQAPTCSTCCDHLTCHAQDPHCLGRKQQGRYRKGGKINRVRELHSDYWTSSTWKPAEGTLYEGSAHDSKGPVADDPLRVVGALPI